MSDENEIVLPLDPKKPWESRTIIGAVITIISLVASFKNVKIDVSSLTDNVMDVIGLFGAAMVIWGRFKATRPISFIGGTMPGGQFNPKAEVKKAEPVSPAPRPPGQSGRADVDALLIIAGLFLLVGIAFCGFPNNSPMASREVPEVIAHHQAADWMQVVRVEDSRPFFTRLLSSLKCTPTLAIVRGTTAGESSYGITLTEIEITGGADF